MKIFVLSALVGALTAISMTQGTHEVKKNRLGAMEVIDWEGDNMIKQVIKPYKEFRHDYV